MSSRSSERMFSEVPTRPTSCQAAPCWAGARSTANQPSKSRLRDHSISRRAGFAGPTCPKPEVAPSRRVSFGIDGALLGPLRPRRRAGAGPRRPGRAVGVSVERAHAKAVFGVERHQRPRCEDDRSPSRVTRAGIDVAVFEQPSQSLALALERMQCRESARPFGGYATPSIVTSKLNQTCASLLLKPKSRSGSWLAPAVTTTLGSEGALRRMRLPPEEAAQRR